MAVDIRMTRGVLRLVSAHLPPEDFSSWEAALLDYLMLMQQPRVPHYMSGLDANCAWDCNN
eukprot:6936297-Prorocentrum_lima.AAC.1